jgi:hypothetical protein
MADDNIDLNVIVTSSIIQEARESIDNYNEQKAFNPSAVHVSIIKREFTGGSPSGRPGRPTHESIGLV